jgi:hypothetical protein
MAVSLVYIGENQYWMEFGANQTYIGKVVGGGPRGGSWSGFDVNGKLVCSGQRRKEFSAAFVYGNFVQDRPEFPPVGQVEFIVS